MRAAISALLLLTLSSSPLLAQDQQNTATSAGSETGSDAHRSARSDVNEAELEFADPRVLVCPDGGYQSGCDAEDIAQAMRLDEDLPRNLAAQCLYATKAACTPTSYGTLLPVAQPSTIIWQLMAIQPADGPQVEMLAMVETEGAVSNLLASSQTEGWFNPPVVVQDSSEVLMIHAPGRSGGTGMGNVDVLLTRHEASWTTFDVNALLDEAAALLPDGFSLAGGVHFDFREMFVSVPVRRDIDGACCASGGVALIDFTLDHPNELGVGSLTFLETAPVETHRALSGENLDKNEGARP